MNVPSWVDEHMPYNGPCLLCGDSDQRHRTLDAIADRLRNTDEYTRESAREVADDYGLPVRFVGRIAREWDTSA